MGFPQPFGEVWASLSLGDLETFLATAGEEALTWECKGAKVHPASVLRTAAGFANSELGGYLILGATWADGAWILSGADLVPDVTAWLGSAVNRLSPRPHHDAKTFTVEGTGARVVVLAIEPVSAPPCLTPDGGVFDRVVGQTVPVTDPGRLAALFARGDAAEQSVERAVGAALTADFVPRGGKGYDLPVILVGLGALGDNLDHERTLFAKPFAELFRGVLNRWWGSGANHCRPQLTFRQDGLAGSLECEFHDARTVRLAARLDGVATLALYTGDPDGLPAACDRQLLGDIWGSIHDLLTGFAADVREVYLSMTVLRNNSTGVPIARRFSLEEPVDPILDSINRDLRRARGEVVWES